MKKRQPGGRVLQAALRAGHVAGQRDQSHLLLSVVKAMRPAHIGGAHQLQFPKNPVHRPRAHLANDHIHQAHENHPPGKADERRRDIGITTFG